MEYREEIREVGGKKVVVKVYPPDEREDKSHRSRYRNYQTAENYARVLMHHELEDQGMKAPDKFPKSKERHWWYRR